MGFELLEEDTLRSFDILHELSQQRLGSIYLARYRRTGEHVVLKQRMFSELGMHRAANDHEARVLLSVRHPSVLRCLGVVSDQSGGGSAVYLVLEFLPDGDLTHVMAVAPRRLLPDAVVAMAAAQLASALAHLHARGIIHRDVKPQNVFARVEMDNTGAPAGLTVKLGDFGVSRVPRDAESRAVIDGGGGEFAATAGVGSPSYMAPEVASGKSYGPAGGCFDFYIIIIIFFFFISIYRKHSAEKKEV
jgi:serine/threonine protein kinase